MAALSRSESRRLYSWWWDSHNTPKNSKWLQENLTGLILFLDLTCLLSNELTFECILRALAERYDHATMDLRQAHQTMAKAFPNQVPYELADDSLLGSSGAEGELHMPKMPHPVHALVDSGDSHKDALGLSSANLGKKKQGRACHIQSSESQLADLENQVLLQKEETKLSNKEYEDELDRVVNAQVEIFILQKFIQDLGEKNSSLLLECKNHVEASKFSNKLILELETKNLEQQVEVEFLLDETKKLKMGVQQIFRAIQFDPVNEHEDGIEEGQIPVLDILHHIEGLKDSLLRNEDEKQQLVIENLMLSTLIGELRLEGAEIKSKKKIFKQECDIMAEQYRMLQKDMHELVEMNMQLRMEASKREQQEEVLKDELEIQHASLESLQGSYLALQEENFKALEENRALLEKFSDLRKKMCILEEENSACLQEVLLQYDS